MHILRLSILIAFFTCNIAHADKTDLTGNDKRKQCLAISGLFVQGNTLISLKEIERLINVKSNCITNNDINALAKDITNEYIKKGYIAARVRFIPINAQGQLGLRVTEGIVEKITGGDKRTHYNMLFPGVVGNPIQISQLDQAIDQANRLQSNQVTLDILPGSNENNSIILIKNKQAMPWHLSGSIDNYGYKNIDEWKKKMSFTLDSPLGLSDVISVSLNKTLDNERVRYKNETIISYSIPCGAFTFSAFINQMQYRRYETLTYNRVKFHGNVRAVNFLSEYTFERSKNKINTLSVQLKNKKTNTHLNDKKIEVSSYQFTTLKLGLNQFFIKPARIIDINTYIERSIPWFGDDKTRGNKNAFQIDNKFTKGGVNFNLNYGFMVLNSRYQLNSILSWQYSYGQLPNSEKFSITERDAIRGFSREASKGHLGWYIKNTLSRHISSANLTFIPRVGIDVGRVLQRDNKQGWQSSAGLSAGVGLYYKKVSLDAEVSRGWLLSERSTRKEPIQILGRLSYAF
ncbi:MULTISPECIES: ShlB/FhaC/HecB family hemolysin secretion/activation protein [Yersinia]|uniref:ShlB/FhaC/HecB family hemolysin secretion/activation protein n=1 Tax=Yersinia intermedia TaxID=631 RepID=A0A0T9LPM9_YERIN|nr:MULTISPECIES: ShlB/FhaC/HecB family hemolysin secretion/activation protein [Yersinia]ARB85270.1 hemolysin activation protein [Yersinia sp. FDAARGOS_228]AVL35084.1 hemolysin activation protein [Yersinia intermedia]CNF12685.1 ShlB/FhaC/HecB family hemolysin secretion/activation protein [Yersinia intermedia]